MVRRRLRLPDHYHRGRAGHPRLDQRAGMVQWQSGPGRLLLDRREPAETRCHRPSGAARLRADELRRGRGRHPGCGGIEGLLLPWRRSHDPGMGAVVWPVRGQAAAETARRRRGRRTGPDLPAVLGDRAGLPQPGVRRSPREGDAAGAKRAHIAADGLAADRLRDLHARRAGQTGPEARLGQRPMGDTRFPYDEIIISWFDRFLCDEADAWQPMPKVHVFLMGACTWLTGESWPLPETQTRTLFLTSDKSANTLWGGGALVPAARGAGIDEFIADPHNPVPSLGGDLATHDPICVDQRVIECRADVLVYSTPVLTEAIAIVGDVSAELYVSADVDDADVFVKLVDVYPDGTAYNLADSCLRLRYRDGFEQPAKLVPGEIYRIRIAG